MSEGEVIFEAPKGKVVINPEGLSDTEKEILSDLAPRLFKKSKEKAEHALERCTFFAEPGHEALTELVAENKNWQDPRIEGCDSNPFDQHYWVVADLVSDQKPRPVIFDPIFGYVGLEEAAKTNIRARHNYNRYYKNKRIVAPGKSVQEGGVRIKTIGI